MWRWFFIVGLILVPFAAQAQSTDSEVAYIRVGHLAIGVDRAEITLNEMVEMQLDPLEFGDYFAVAAGEHNFALLTPEIDLLATLTFEAGKRYVVFINGAVEIGNVGFNFVEEDSEPLPDNDSVRLYVYNGLPALNLDLELRDVSRVFLPNLSYWGTTLLPNSYYLDFLETDTENVVLEATEALDFLPYHVYFVGITRLNGEPTATVISDSRQAQITLQHFLIDPLTFNLFLDEIPIFTDIGYQANVPVLNIESRTYHLRIVTSNVEDELVIYENEAFRFSPDTSYAFYVQGQLPQFEVDIVTQALDYATSELQTGEVTQILLRNSLVDVESIDLIGADGLLYIDDLRFGEVGSLSLLPTTFDWAITVHGEPENVLFDLSGIELEGGRVYNMVATGQLATIQQGQQRLFVTNQCFKPDCE